MKLELGAGHRPTRGYEHNDLHPFDHIEHVGEPRMLDLPDNSLDEVLALGFIEHLTYYDALDTFRNVARMLKRWGSFLFDVPDYPQWASWYLRGLDGEQIPVSMDHVRRTLFGWGRWPGDEHKYGWDWDQLLAALDESGMDANLTDPVNFEERTHRARFSDKNDPHLYVVASAKP